MRKNDECNPRLERDSGEKGYQNKWWNSLRRKLINGFNVIFFAKADSLGDRVCGSIVSDTLLSTEALRRLQMSAVNE